MDRSRLLPRLGEIVRLYLTGLGGRNFRLDWQCLPFFQDRIGFFIDGTTDFGIYQRIISSVSGDTQGRYTTPLDASTHPTNYFYRAGMKLQ